VHRNTIVAIGAGVTAAAMLGVGGVALASAADRPAGQQVAASSATGTHTPGQDNGKGKGKAGAPGQQGRPDRTARIAQEGLTGDVAVKVTQAAVAKEPAAYLLHVEKGEAGGYEARMMRPDGTFITLTIDAGFQVTAVDTVPAPGGKGGKGGHGPRDGKPGMPPTSAPATT